ncbi:hypothetical protein LUZ60_013469 [Juncus effusus]|nr:hypothetical protein LUZ60_013469 [Juncus effusus]
MQNNSLSRRPQPGRRQQSPLPPPSPRRTRDQLVGDGGSAAGKAPKPTSPVHPAGEMRTVKKLQKVKPLTLPEGTMILEACKRMASRRVDAALITDSSGLLSGILTAEDVSKRVIAEGLRPEQTSVSRAMTKNPVFIMVDSPAIEAMQKMVQGKFRHLPVVENDEVIAMMDITKFLFDAISQMEKVAEQGHAIAAAVEGVERQLGNDILPVSSARHAFMENLWEKMFKPSLSTIIPENTIVPVVSPSDPVLLAAQKMCEHKVNSVVVMLGDTLQGIFTSKDLALRVVAQSFAPEVTPVEKVMTANPDCATLDTSILDALHSMHDGKFLHIPVLDEDGHIAACLDVLQLTHAAISMVEGNGGSLNEMANTMMHKFWESTMHPLEEDYDHRGMPCPAPVSVEGPDELKQHNGMMSPPHVSNSFVFKVEDRKGCWHRFSCVLESLEELICAVKQRIGIENEKDNIQLLYEDDERDKVVLLSDSDLFGAVYHARSSGLKVLRLHIDDNSDPKVETAVTTPQCISNSQNGWSTFQVSLMASAAALASVALVASLKHSHN